MMLDSRVRGRHYRCLYTCGQQWLRVGASCLFFLPAAVAADPIDELPPGHWLEVRATIASVAPRLSPAGVQGPASVIGQASGGAFDSQRDRLLVWGGGHTAYAGNEVYAFDLKALKWLRLTEPSRDVGGYERSGYYPDGAPRARHTYDYVEYLPPPIDRFCCFGASGMYPSGQGAIGNVDCLNPDTLKWERRANALSYGIGAISGYDAKTGRVWLHGAGSHGFLNSYDPMRDRWSAHGRPGIEAQSISFEPTAAVDPMRRKLVAVGSGNVLVWDLDAPGLIKGRPLATKGDTGIVFSKSPGFEYDPVIKQFVAWSGGADVFILDLDSATWRKVPPSPGNKVTPGPAASRGTFGRFRYVPSRNVYVVVSDIYESVFLYRLTPKKGR